MFANSHEAIHLFIGKLFKFNSVCILHYQVSLWRERTVNRDYKELNKKRDVSNLRIDVQLGRNFEVICLLLRDTPARSDGVLLTETSDSPYTSNDNLILRGVGVIFDGFILWEVCMGCHGRTKKACYPMRSQRRGRECVSRI